MKEQNKRRCRLLQICSDGHVSEIAELGLGESPGDERQSRSPFRIPGIEWDINLTGYRGRNPYLRERTITADTHPSAPVLHEVDTATRIPVILPIPELDTTKLPSSDVNIDDGRVPAVDARGYHIQDQPNTLGLPGRPNYDVNKIVDADDPLDEFKRQTANLDTRPVKVAERAGNLLALVDALDYLMWAQQQGYFKDKDTAIQAIFEYADHLVPGVIAGVAAPFVAFAQDGLESAVQTAIATWNPVTPITSLLDRAFGTDITSDTNEFLTSIERSIGLPVSPDPGSIKLNEVYTDVKDVYDRVTAAFRDVPDAPVYDQEYSNGVQQYEGVAQGTADVLDNVLGVLNTVDDFLDDYHAQAMLSDPAYRSLAGVFDSFVDGVGTVISTASNTLDTIGSIELPNDITVGELLPTAVREVTGYSSRSSANQPKATTVNIPSTIRSGASNKVYSSGSSASQPKTTTVSTTPTIRGGASNKVYQTASGPIRGYTRGH